MRKLFVAIISCFVLCFGFACSSNSNDENSTTVEQSDPSNTEGSENEGVTPTPNETSPNEETVDGGNGATPDPEPNKEPTNQVECIAQCETNHPTAAQDNHALDNTCMFGVCGHVCNNLGQGQNFFPDTDAGAMCDTATAGSFPIGTPSQACSNCLAATTECCNLWVKIFGSAEGQSLNRCAHTCWEKFPN